jgi:hypothetical protein
MIDELLAQVAKVVETVVPYSYGKHGLLNTVYHI